MEMDPKEMFSTLLETVEHSVQTEGRDQTEMQRKEQHDVKRQTDLPS